MPMGKKTVWTLQPESSSSRVWKRPVGGGGACLLAGTPVFLVQDRLHIRDKGSIDPIAL